MDSVYHFLRWNVRSADKVKRLIFLSLFGLTGCVQPHTTTVANVPECPGCLPAYPDDPAIQFRQSSAVKPPLTQVSTTVPLCRPDAPGRTRIDQLMGALTVIAETYNHGGTLGRLEMKEAVEYGQKMIDYDETPGSIALSDN